jgi:signal transduction histidine kinase
MEGRVRSSTTLPDQQARQVAKRRPTGRADPQPDRVHVSAEQARKTLQQLFDVEYGAPAEIGVRLGGSLVGAVMLYTYTGWLSALVWVATYFAVHLMYFTLIRWGLRTPGSTVLGATVALYLLVLAAFLWFPVQLAAHGEPVLSFAGMLVIATAMVFHIRRADVLLWLVWGQVAVLGAALLCVVALRWPELDGSLPKTGALLVTGFAVLFLSQTMLLTRRYRIEVDRSAERLAREQKEAAIGRLAGGVAHDFNNVLTVVLGNLELYREFDDQTEKDTAVAEAERAAARAQGVVQQLLIYARKAPTRHIRLDCNVVVQEVLASLTPRIPDGIDTELALAAPCLWVVVDEAQMALVVDSLLRNALDALGQTGTLRIETTRVQLHSPHDMVDGGVLMPGSYAEVSVIDDGHGIPDGILGRVTEPFFTTRAPGHGSGLGLSMVKGFAHEAGGGLHIMSGRQGTTASLYLPLSLEE